MSLSLVRPQATELKPRIVVFGVGGAGGNAVNNMIDAGLEGVEFVVANTDAQHLSFAKTDRRVQLGETITQGLGAVQVPVDLLGRFLGGVHADLGVGARAQPLRDGLAQLDAAVGLGERQVLGVGVGDDELDPFEAGVDHVVDGVAAGAADAEDDDAGLQFRVLRTHQRE